MFIGEYSHNLDSKGRLSVPAKFRRNLREGVVITRGLDRCLFVYPQGQWNELAAKLSQLPLSQRNSRAFARLMLAGAWDCQLDSQGRIIVPEYLRQYASLAKHVVVTGLYNRLEVWDDDLWTEYKVKAEAASDDIAEAMVDLGI
jgi:MraZ protein